MNIYLNDRLAIAQRFFKDYHQLRKHPVGVTQLNVMPAAKEEKASAVAPRMITFAAEDDTSIVTLTSIIDDELVYYTLEINDGLNGSVDVSGYTIEEWLTHIKDNLDSSYSFDDSGKVFSVRTDIL